MPEVTAAPATLTTRMSPAMPRRSSALSGVLEAMSSEVVTILDVVGLVAQQIPFENRPKHVPLGVRQRQAQDTPRERESEYGVRLPWK